MAGSLLPPLLPPFPYVGGKSRVAAGLVAQFPPHERYVEPFLGSGSVTDMLRMHSLGRTTTNEVVVHNHPQRYAQIGMWE